MSRRWLAVFALCALGAAACVSERAVEPQAVVVNPSVANLTGEANYLLDAQTTLPADLEAKIAAAGGRLTGTVSQIGVAYAASADPAFAQNAAKIGGISGVDADPIVQMVEPDPTAEMVEVDAAEVPVGGEAIFGSTETFRMAQWAPDAVHAPEAWDLGARGAGARVRGWP